MNEEVKAAQEERKALSQDAANFAQHPFWKYLMNVYIGDRIKAFTNDAILKGYKSMEDFEAARGQVRGLRDLVGHVNQLVEDGRKQDGEK